MATQSDSRTLQQQSRDAEAPPRFAGLSPLKTALVMTALWRLCVGVAGAAAHFVLPTGGNYLSLLGRQWPINPLTLMADSSIRLDAYWYASIALHGYNYSPHHISSIGYFPLFPVLIKSVSLLTGDVYAAGIIVSTASMFFAVWAFYAWLVNRGLQAQTVTVIAVLLSFQFAFFLAAMFTESLYLALALATFVFAERNQWVLASIFTFLAILCRPTALALLLALLVLAWSTKSRGPLAPFVTGVVALGAFCAYQFVAFGTPLAYVRTHAAPPGGVTPRQILLDLTLHARPGMPSWYLGFMLFWGILFLMMVPHVYRRFGPAYATFTILSVLLPLTSSLPGLERYVVVAFPVFAILALEARRRTFVLLIGTGFVTEMAFAAMFARGYGLF